MPIPEELAQLAPAEASRYPSRLSSRSALPSASWAGTSSSAKEQTIDDLKFPNHFKEVFLDSDTKVACISGSYSVNTADSFLTNDMKYAAREKVNKEAGREAHILARDLHRRARRLAGEGRGGAGAAQARLVEGLHEKTRSSAATTRGSIATRRSSRRP